MRGREVRLRQPPLTGCSLTIYYSTVGKRLFSEFYMINTLRFVSDWDWRQSPIGVSGTRCGNLWH
jgi:hypothetical protein